MLQDLRKRAGTQVKIDNLLLRYKSKFLQIWGKYLGMSFRDNSDNCRFEPDHWYVTRTSITICDEKLSNNSLRLKAANCCYKALYLRGLRRSRLRSWMIQTQLFTERAVQKKIKLQKKELNLSTYFGHTSISATCVQFRKSSWHKYFKK